MASLDKRYISQSTEQFTTPPQTPPDLQSSVKIVHTWPEPETEPEYRESAKRRRTNNTKHKEALPIEDFDALHQEVLLLHAPKQRYAHTKEQQIPSLENEREMLVAVDVVGLNPIDWKAPDFGFGLPDLPCISGRDFAGKVVKVPKTSSRFCQGDIIMAISTDYRDSRKSAYQQYAVVSDFNACRLPQHLAAQDAAPLGVAFVAATLALGICMGLEFKGGDRGPRGPDLLRTMRYLPQEVISEDVRQECFHGIRESERPKQGEWLAIWGGSSATGCIAVQLAKLAGLKVIAIVDVAKNGERMLKYGADLLVDRLDTERAVAVVKGITKGKMRFALDTRGKDSALLLAQAMESQTEEGGCQSHVVGLTGLPKEPVAGVVYHSVPIKAFHEAPQIGEALMIWLEKLLEDRLLATPDIEVASGGLEGINAALDRLRDGSVNGPRIVVPLKT